MTATSNPLSKFITKLVLSRERYGGGGGVGARIRRYIGRPEFRNHDLFLMLDELLVDKNGGFPDHPHLGFETASCMVKGQLQHEASAGHRGTIGPKICNG
ncbi:RmlC-like cupin [Linnemannia elongata AG-77]|uniref:RmlC-like cupin n=1 Tax=Linnemannia elongata AG-77 TaxID=1314771 RepID=A0A197JGH7_9FUNG|nr:RmlC-like cupin [Linnemannia elongata AG-77]